MCIITTTAVVSAATAIGVSLSTTAATAVAVGANVVLAAGVAGGIVSGISSYQQGKAQQAQHNYQAQMDLQNKQIAENKAVSERQQGIEESRLQRLKVKSVVGQQQAAMAANGIDVSQGTAVDVIADTASLGELDALQTRYNYESRAINYEQQANNFANQANLDIISGENAMQAGRMNALASGLNTVSKTGEVASRWFGFGGGAK